MESNRSEEGVKSVFDVDFNQEFIFVQEPRSCYGGDLFCCQSFSSELSVTVEGSDGLVEVVEDDVTEGLSPLSPISDGSICGIRFRNSVERGDVDVFPDVGGGNNELVI